MRPLRLSDDVSEGAAVFQLSFDLEVDPPINEWKLLNADERAQARRFHQQADVVRFVCTRATLRRLLGACLQTRPELLSFEMGQHGKPQLAGACSTASGIHFNVSHSGCHALVAISSRWPIGVDIERRDTCIDIAELEGHVFSPLERQVNPKSQIAFFDRWTAKEAVLKAWGVGVTEHLQQLSVLKPIAEGRDGTRYCLQYDGLDWPELKACRLPAPDGYAAALAWTEASAKDQP